MNKTVAEFFAGIGLMRLGLERAGWETTWANDICEDKKRIYDGHFRDLKPHFVLGDVHKINGRDIPDIALATASFPCTDLSLAGARKGLAGEHSGAFWGFINAIKGMGSKKPPIVLLENVTGFLTSNDGNDFRDACLAINELGYSVDALIIDASHFVPQSRQRLFVIGIQEDVPAVVGETDSFYQGSCRPAALADFILWHPEIKWNIRPVPDLPKQGYHLNDIIEEVPLNSSIWWNKERSSYLLNQMSDKHRAEADRMIAGDKVTYGTVFRRVRNGISMAELRTDGRAGCLRTPRGGSGRQILFAAGLGKYSVRLVTPRECARLMGAPDYKLGADISLNQALFGFGDAVCVSVVEWIANNYLNPVFQDLYATKKVVAKKNSYRLTSRK
jgi:DNA (cytosine-5)-methyltransferase 1